MNAPAAHERQLDSEALLRSSTCQFNECRYCCPTNRRLDAT